jgi:hypothetical protein
MSVKITASEKTEIESGWEEPGKYLNPIIWNSKLFQKIN